MKIWDTSIGDAEDPTGVVYDNQLGDGKNSSLITSLAGGEIVIHEGGKKNALHAAQSARPPTEGIAAEENG